MNYTEKNRAVIRFYDDLSDNFDNEQEAFAFVRLPEKEIIMDTLNNILSHDQNVLEIGAGTGRFTLNIAPYVKKVTALDLSERMLEKMLEKINKNSIKNVELVSGDFLKTPFSNQFDLIVSFSAIEYILDTEALFQKMASLTKPGGKLIITTAHDTFFRQFGRIGNYFRQKIYMEAYSKNKISKLLHKNGFVIDKLQDLVMKSFITKGILLYVVATKE